MHDSRNNIAAFGKNPDLFAPASNFIQTSSDVYSVRRVSKFETLRVFSIILEINFVKKYRCHII